MSFDDILGEEHAPPPAPYGRDLSLRMNTVHEVLRGVTVPWLCQVFNMTKPQVEKRLENCPVLRRVGPNGKVYELAVAAAYLVKPKVTIEQYINSIDTKDLPERIRKEFWTARLQEQKWRQKAGELWSSQDVITVFGEVFKMIKNQSQLWSDTLESTAGLSDEQRILLGELVDDLMGKIFDSLTALKEGKATPSQLAEVEEDDVEI
jgi:hypothetical protein